MIRTARPASLPQYRACGGTVDREDSDFDRGRLRRCPRLNRVVLRYRVLVLPALARGAVAGGWTASTCGHSSATRSPSRARTPTEPRRSWRGDFGEHADEAFVVVFDVARTSDPAERQDAAGGCGSLRASSRAGTPAAPGGGRDPLGDIGRARPAARQAARGHSPALAPGDGQSPAYVTGRRRSSATSTASSRRPSARAGDHADRRPAGPVAVFGLSLAVPIPFVFAASTIARHARSSYQRSPTRSRWSRT